MKILEKLQDLKAQIIPRLKQVPKLAWIVLVLVIFIVIIAGGKSNTSAETATVERRDVVEQVVLSGRTESGSAVDLGFADSGRVASVPVREGQTVYRGQLLASLETSDLAADLRDAQADLTIAQAGLQNTENNLDAITDEENAMVASAYRTLLSEGLVAVPDSSLVTVTPPVLSGSYDGNEGIYKVIIERQSATSRDFDVRTFDLERTVVTADKEQPTRLGTRGLYITFPDGLDAYHDTIWYVTIPNKTSDAYLSNYNAYQEALRRRDRVLADAKADLSGTNTEASIAAARVEQARARVDAILAQIAKRRIVAPFSGTVANIDLRVGETASASGGTSEHASGIKLISETDYEIVLKAPEIDIAKLVVGQKASVVFDAYGTDAPFIGTIVSINPAETIIDGVPVYETHVVFDAPDERIRSGMTASATIVTHTAPGVLSIPASFIHTEKNESFVYLVLTEDKIEKRVITTGLRGSDSSVEITSGLAEGDSLRSDAN